MRHHAAGTVLRWPLGCSVCMIDETQNRMGGSALGTFYLNNRIINYDAFWLDVTG